MHAQVLGGALLSLSLAAASFDAWAEDYPGWSETGDAPSISSKSCTVDGGAYDNIFLAEASGRSSADADGNVLTVNGSSVHKAEGAVYAGCATISPREKGTAKAGSNKLFIRKLTTTGPGSAYYDINAGRAVLQTYSTGSAAADGNSVEVSDGSIVYMRVLAAHVEANNGDGDAAQALTNNVSIKDSQVAGPVYGAEAFSFKGSVSASSNSVRIENSTIGAKEGGAAQASTNTNCVYGAAVNGKTTTGAKNNTVTVINSRTNGLSSAYHAVRGLYLRSSGDIKDTGGNRVVLSQSTVDGSVMGTYLWGDKDAADDGSSAAVSDGSFVTRSVTGAFVYTAGQAIARPGAEAAVTVKNSTVQKGVWGAYVYSAQGSAQACGHKVLAEDSAISGSLVGADARTGAAESAAASGNTLTMKGGTCSGSIVGGQAVAAEKGTALSQNNTIILAQGRDGSSPVFNESRTVIWGSYAAAGGRTEKDWTSGNTVKFDHVKGMSAANLKNVSTLDYQLPDMKAGEAVLTLTGGADAEKTDISGASVKVAVRSIAGRDGGVFRAGDRIILLQNEKGGLVSDGIVKEPIAVQQGVSLQYKLTMETDQRTLYLTRVEDEEPVVSPGSKSVAEGWLAGLGMIAQAANVVEDLSIRLNDEGWLPFALVEGGSMRYNTGSHIDTSALSLIAGIGRGVQTDAGLLIAGGFFEYGTGFYKTHNSFAGRSDIDGAGSAWYMGGGILASMDFKDTGPGHFYVEGSGHMGMLHNSYDNDDLRDASGRAASFETDTPYYAVHGGLGYVWDIDENNELDVYGKYLWARVEGTEETLTTGDRYAFDDADSSRIRLGARYTCKGNERFRPYIGAAWEHEFAGDGNASAYGYDLSAPSFRGDSARGELGIEMTPTKDLPLTINLGVQGYLGQKEGVSGSCFVQYTF